ncbi:DsbE family thiol:disulfide interchange protein [Nostoc sp. CHAB 5834]|nr:DsbE family thiol:disulfide interchange protein [Nostoc sp. CHAB 5834]
MKRPSLRAIGFATPVVGFLVVAVLLGMGLRRDPAILPSMLIGQPLPAFDLQNAPGRTQGRPLASSDLNGEPTLLNVFASWCVSCRVEHPLLMRLARDGEPLHGLNWKDGERDGTRWLAEFGDPYDRVGHDPSGRTGIDLGVTGAPETFVIDRHGVVRYRHVGPITDAVWTETLAPMLADLRAEP